MPKTKIPIREYLICLISRGVIPNFYCSEAYLTACEAQAYSNGFWVTVEADGWTLFPPVPAHRGNPFPCPGLLGLDLTVPIPPHFPTESWWSDFINYSPQLSYYSGEFLDWEYTYLATDFQEDNLRGSRWEVFRKNIRKWPNRTGLENYLWDFRLEPKPKQAAALFEKWLVLHPNVQDGEIILRFLTDATLPATHQHYLWKKGKLVGINVVDYTAITCNFRFSIADPDEPFLGEFLRWGVLRNGDFYVNDGGCLGNKGLEQFKDRLNPRIKRAVHSMIYNGEQKEENE